MFFYGYRLIGFPMCSLFDRKWFGMKQIVYLSVMIPLPFYNCVEIRCCIPKLPFSLPFLWGCLFTLFSSLWYYTLPHQQSNNPGVLPGCCLNHLAFHTAQIVTKRNGGYTEIAFFSSLQSTLGTESILQKTWKLVSVNWTGNLHMSHLNIFQILFPVS